MPNKPSILYVDDERLNTKLFELNFSKKFQVFTASGGAQGLTILETEPGISLVISDMKMPGLNGIEFIKMAKEQFPQKNYFILSGFETTPEIQDALDSKLILKYFWKPFKMTEIVEEMEKYI